MNDTWYDTAQICIKGHVITEHLKLSPNRRQKYCEQCGKSTIESCNKCSAQIRGYYNVPGYLGSGPDYEKPSFCHECGNLHPWTITTLHSAEELADEIDGLKDEEKEMLKKSLPDLLSDNPRTILASTRFKLYMAKAGSVVGNGMKEILIGIVSEAARKAIWPNS